MIRMTSNAMILGFSTIVFKAILYNICGLESNICVEINNVSISSNNLYMGKEKKDHKSK